MIFTPDRNLEYTQDFVGWPKSSVGGIVQTPNNTQPPKVMCKIEAQLDYVPTHCTHVFARLALTCMLSRCFLTKFQHRSSVGS